MYQFFLDSLALAGADSGTDAALCYILLEPHIDDDLGLSDTCEPFGIQDFVA